MCKYLDPACFMANVFASCPDQTTMTFEALRKVRDHVSGSLAEQNVVIEWTRDSVMGALECYSDLFVKGERDVAWRASENRDAARKIFDAEFSANFVDALKNAIREEVDSITSRTESVTA